MSWLRRYRFRSFFRNSFWFVPVLGILAAVGTARALDGVEVSLGTSAEFNAEAARSVLGTLAASMFTFIVFISSALLVVLQLAAAQLTPRMLGIVFRNPKTKAATTVFVFVFTFTLSALVRVTTAAPRLMTLTAAYSSLASLGVFLYLIDYIGRALRPSGAVGAVGRLGRLVILDVYPRAYSEVPQGSPAVGDGVELGAPTLEISSQIDGVILAADWIGLAALARRSGCVIEFVPQVGDYLAAGDPLFRVFGGTVSQKVLCDSVAVGQERTIEQDPMFVFRILVDIANKGLSPAINDPTTAVLVLDQIHHLLRVVGTRYLDEGQLCDADGRVRLVYRTPDWDDFVHLAVTEIRHYGGDSIQIARRLHAMLENLTQVLPEDRAPALQLELELLRRTTLRSFPEPEDQAMAEVSDRQGVGGRNGRKSDRGEFQSEPIGAAKTSGPPT